MRVWTMQTRDIELTDCTIDHSKSPYARDFPKYSELCNVLSERLGTDQFIWCLTEDEETWNGREKWALIVPEDHVCLICSITWHWLLTRSHGGSRGCTIPDRFFNLSRRLNVCFSRDEFHDQFHRDWRNKTIEELWDMLFVDDIGGACTDALVLCPIEKGWITERPLWQQEPR